MLLLHSKHLRFIQAFLYAKLTYRGSILIWFCMTYNVRCKITVWIHPCIFCNKRVFPATSTLLFVPSFLSSNPCLTFQIRLDFYLPCLKKLKYPLRLFPSTPAIFFAVSSLFSTELAPFSAATIYKSLRLALTHDRFDHKWFLGSPSRTPFYYAFV